MTAHIALPDEELIECWSLVREIARTLAPDPDTRAVGIDCIVGKIFDPVRIPGTDAELPLVEQPLDDGDRQYLLRVLPDLPTLEYAFPVSVTEAFLDAFRARSDRPAWEPLLLTEDRFIRECSKAEELRWVVSCHHQSTLQQWLDLGRISAFYRQQVPTIELTIGALIPRADVEIYLDNCGITYLKRASITQADKLKASDPVFKSSRESQAVNGSPAVSTGAGLTSIPTGPLLDIKEVSKRTGISVSMLHEKMKANSKYFDPTFPGKVSLGARTVRYDQNSIDAWIQAQMTRQTS